MVCLYWGVIDSLEVHFSSQKYLITILALIKVHVIWTCSISVQILRNTNIGSIYIILEKFKTVWCVKSNQGLTKDWAYN